MSKITLDNLSDNLKAYLEGLGLTEEQVLNLINENGLNEEELKAMLKDSMSINELNTNSKTVIGAINELFQSANNGKELIASAIGEPLDSNDTFSAMSNDINGLLSTFKTNMMNSGVMVESSDKFKQLIDKIKGLTEGEGNKGVKYAEGETTVDLQYIDSSTYVNQTQILDFTPSIVFVTYTGYNNGTNNFSYTVYGNGYTVTETVNNIYFYNSDNNYRYNTVYRNTQGSQYEDYVDMYITTSKNKFDVHHCQHNVYGVELSYKWFAIGVGEEDTTLRDSLADILENKGVDVTEEDDIASLITKVDSMNTINTDKSQLLCYKVDEITYNLDSSNYGNDYFNVFVKDDFAYFIVQDKGMQTYGTISCNCKFIKYNIKTGEVVLEKIQYDNQAYGWRIADAYMGYDDIVIVGEFGIHSISLNDFTATQIFRDANRISTNAKSFRIGDILYCGLNGRNYDYSSVVIAYNIKTKTVVNTIYTPRLSTSDYDELLYFLCPDLINGKIYFIGGDYGYPFYQTDLSLNVINTANLYNSTSKTKFNSRFAFANDTKLSVITQDLNSRYPNVCEINIADPLSECTNRSLNCECFLDGNIDLSSFTVYTYLEAPCVEYYGQYMFIKHKDSFVRINTLNGTSINISISLYFKIFRVIDENTIECVTRTGIYTFRIEEI